MVYYIPYTWYILSIIFKSNFFASLQKKRALKKSNVLLKSNAFSAFKKIKMGIEKKSHFFGI